MGKPAADGPDSWRIGTFEIGDSPSPISVVQEHAKAVLALSTGLLGASAAFIERLIGTQPSASQLVWTAIAWAALVVSIAFAVLCNAHLFKYLSWQRNWQRSRKSAALFGALAPWPLLFGAVILAILTLANAASSAKGTPRGIVHTCRRFLTTVGVTNGSAWTVSALEFDNSHGQYRVVLQNGTDIAHFSIGSTAGNILEYRCELGGNPLH